jgi:hypothetical protein
MMSAMAYGTRHVAATSLIVGVSGVLALSVVQMPAHAQTAAPAPAPSAKTLNVAKFEPIPKILTGTLFNTREQRERLDRARRRGGVPEDEAVVVAVVAKESEHSVINGFVKRSDGRDTVWVDDVMKRDPRSEVMEQLEPNVVGGVGNVKLQMSKASPSNASVSRKVVSKRASIPTQSHRKTKSRLNTVFKTR